MMLMEVKKLSRSEKSVVTLVVDRDTGSRYVRKELRGAHPVYQQLQGLPHSFLPKIIQVEPGQDGVTLLEEYIDGAAWRRLSCRKNRSLPSWRSCVRCWCSSTATGSYTGTSSRLICCWHRTDISG